MKLNWKKKAEGVLTTELVIENISALKWFDYKPVHVLSIYAISEKKQWDCNQGGYMLINAWSLYLRNLDANTKKQMSLCDFKNISLSLMLINDHVPKRGWPHQLDDHPQKWRKSAHPAESIRKDN